MKTEEMNITKVGGGIFLAIALVSIVGTLTAAATTVTIQSAEVDLSESITLPIQINNVTGVKGAHIVLEYDSSVVHALEIGNSSFGIETFKEINNVTGYVRYATFNLVGLNGNVKFADVTLKGMGVGSSPLNLTIVALTNGTAEIPRDVVNGTFTVTVDNPPQPNITSPLAGATLAGLVAIEEIDESGEGDIVYNLFEYYSDADCNGEADDAGSAWTAIYNDTNGGDGWRAEWNTADLSDCCYLIRATMGDEGGQTGQAEVSVALSNHDPVPNITTPQSGAILSGLVAIEAVDDSFDGGADIVYNLFEYYSDADCNGEADDAGSAWTAISNDTNGGDGWRAEWNTTELADGCYLIRATMGDRHGRTGEAMIGVEIRNNMPPEVANPYAVPSVIPEDTDNNPLWGEVANLSVVVTDDDAIVSVTIDRSLLGGSAEQPMTRIGGSDQWYVLTNASVGTAGWNGSAYVPYLLQVNATDQKGASNNSMSIELLVMKNGDVDENGATNLDDASYLANWALHVPGYDLVPEVADVDGSGAANLDDAIYLANYAMFVPGYETLH
jgi:hypothetical protein